MHPLIFGIVALLGYAYYKKQNPSAPSAANNNIGQNLLNSLETGGSKAAQTLGSSLTSSLSGAFSSGSSQQTSNKSPIIGQGNPTNASNNSLAAAEAADDQAGDGNDYLDPDFEGAG